MVAAVRTFIGASGTGSDSASGTSVSSTAKVVQPGAFVFCYARWEGGAADAVSLTDSVGGNYKLLAPSVGANPGVAVWYCWNHPGGSAVVATDTISTSRSYHVVNLFEFSGGDTTDPVERVWVTRGDFPSAEGYIPSALPSNRAGFIVTGYGTYSNGAGWTADFGNITLSSSTLYSGAFATRVYARGTSWFSKQIIAGGVRSHASFFLNDPQTREDTLKQLKGPRRIWAPAAAVGGGFQAAWASQISGVIGAGVR